ncbi:MAG: hypothetical protein IKQ37_07090, partial [Bacteroidaceae bacterium]|nr:hypothetical protein [Bacteroidaceae bacterium]
AYFNVKSLRFHYAFQNHFIAGTDNCSKNTYYVVDPVTHLIELHQDDVDTTIATDNFGFQTKPYYVDRMNPYDDNDTVRAENESCYDGMLNTLFDLVEAMWEENGTIANAVGSILNSMLSLTGGIGSAESNTQGGVWRTLNRYLFDIQRYFPQVAFNETARIRYEFPAMLGFIGRNGEADPLAQSMGDQLEAEIQFMKRRLIYMASYAGFGEFAATTGTSTGSTGIGDAVATLAVNSVALPNGGTPDQTFTVKPHQYLFPVFTWQSQTNATRRRTAPGEAFTYTTAFQFANTYPIELRGLNYYRSVGNLGDKTINASSFSIQGTRLTEFIAEPTTYYSMTQGGGSITRSQYEALSDAQKAGYAPAFSKPANLQISNDQNGATRLRKLSLNGCTTTGSTAMVPFNLSRLTLVEEIDLRNTIMQSVTLPETATLATLHLPGSLTMLSLVAQPALSTLTMQGYDGLTQFIVTGSPLIGGSVRAHVLAMMGVSTGLSVMKLAGLDWLSQPVDGDVIRWLLGIGDTGACDLAGSIATTTGVNGRLTYEDVAKLIMRYGNIRSTDNTLYIRFSGTSISESSMSIEGKKYINTNSASDDYDLDASDNFNELALLVSSGNDVGVATDGQGHTVPNVAWDLVQDDGNGGWEQITSSYAEFQNTYSPVLHLKQKGNAVRGITLNVRVTLTNTNGEERVAVKVIGLWNREPEVGDYAWTDGQFDNTNDASKKLAGVVIRKTKVQVDGKDVFDLDILSAADATFPSSLVSGGYESSWGLYAQTSQSDGFTDAKTNGAYNDPVMNAILLAVQSWTKPSDISYAVESDHLTDIFDTPLKDIAGGEYIRKNAAAVTAAGSGIAMQDANNDGNDGYNTFTQEYMNNFMTKEENAILMSYADEVLKAALQALNITQEDYPAGCTSEGIPTTTQALYDLAELIVQKASDAGATKPSRYRQLLFMAARKCNVWCPADISGSLVEESKLHDSYKRGNWRLPASGLLARIFNFLGNSRATYASTGSPSEDYADENVELEAQLPLFANAIARGRAIPVSAGSTHWSSTEYGRTGARYVSFSNGNAHSYNKSLTYVIRPVTAFRFVP